MVFGTEQDLGKDDLALNATLAAREAGSAAAARPPRKYAMTAGEGRWQTMLPQSVQTRCLKVTLPREQFVQRFPLDRRENGKGKGASEEQRLDAHLLQLNHRQPFLKFTRHARGISRVLPALLAAVTTVKYLTDWHHPTLLQRALANFLDSGALSRHIRRRHSMYWVLAGDARPGLFFGFGAIDPIDIDVALDRLYRLITELGQQSSQPPLAREVQQRLIVLITDIRKRPAIESTGGPEG